MGVGGLSVVTALPTGEFLPRGSPRPSGYWKEEGGRRGRWKYLEVWGISLYSIPVPNALEEISQPWCVLQTCSAYHM